MNIVITEELPVETEILENFSPETYHSSRQLYNVVVNTNNRVAERALGKAIIAPGISTTTKRILENFLGMEAPKYNLDIYRRMYVKIDLLHEGVNKFAETLTENGFRFSAPSHVVEDEDFEDLSSDLKANLKKLRRWGRWTTFGTFMTQIFKPTLWAGNGYAEIVYDEKEEWKIVDLKIIDPREMRVVRSPFGEVIGYVQYPFNGYLGVLTPLVAEKFKKNGGIFFLPHEVLHIKWNPLPGEAYGQSIFEAMKDIVADVTGMRIDLGLIAHNHASPTTHYQMGTDLIPASQAAIDDFSALVTTMDNSMDLVTSTMVKSNPIKDPSKVLDMPRFLRTGMNIFYASLGLPEIMFGQGNETTEATAKSQIEATSKKFRAMQRNFREQVELTIFSRLLLGKTYYQLSPDDMDLLPEIYFAPIETSEEKKLRLGEAVKNGSITHEEWRVENGMLPKRKGQVVLAEDREYQMELIDKQAEIMKQKQAQAGQTGGANKTTKKDGPSKTAKKDQRNTARK